MSRLERTTHIPPVFEYHGPRLHVFRLQRSAWWRTEWHNYAGVRYARLTVGHPRRHARWAFDVTFYVTRGRR